MNLKDKIFFRVSYKTAFYVLLAFCIIPNIVLVAMYQNYFFYLIMNPIKSIVSIWIYAMRITLIVKMW